MRLTINQMKITNFKGLSYLEIDFAQQTIISGMNGTGKSSIVDAFCWTLWNKNSAGDAPGSDSFREKPLGEDGKEIHNLDTSVEMICTLDGKPFNLKRLQRENWVKKRGSTQPSYSGNVSYYWINDVEVKLEEFKERIALIADEEVFRLIGSLSAFNAMEWKKRRQQLINLSDTDVDGQLLAIDTYRELADECAQRGIGIDDLRKVLVSQRKLKNDEIKSFPIRIDEARKALPKFGPHELSDAQYVVNDTQKDIDRIDALIAECRASSGTSGINARILALRTELATMRNEIASKHREKVREIESRIESANRTILICKRDIASVEDDIKRREIALKDATQRRNALRAEYTAAYESKFDGKVDTVCPTCKQNIPDDMVRAAMERNRILFDEQRRGKLTSIKESGVSVARSVKELEDGIKELDKRLDELKSEVEASNQATSEAKAELASIGNEPDYSSNPRIAELGAELDKIIEESKESPESKVEALIKRKAELMQIIDKNKAILMKREAAAETEARIKALEHAQLEAADQLSDIEAKIMLLEKFVMDRCDALEESINEKFPTIRWKLFDTQINGGITDTCICMIPCNGALVSYESANTASRVNADVEIVNVLSAHYGVSVPLFVDNSERVNQIAHTESQLITLAVSGGDLRIEHKEES